MGSHAGPIPVSFLRPPSLQIPGLGLGWSVPCLGPLQPCWVVKREHCMGRLSPGHTIRAGAGCKPTVWGTPWRYPAPEHKWVGSSLALGSGVHEAPARDCPPWKVGAGLSFIPESTCQYLPWPEDYISASCFPVTPSTEASSSINKAALLPGEKATPKNNIGQ